MTTFNTGNPVPSANPKDLYDNGQTIDTYTNGKVLGVLTRTKKAIKTFAGIEKQWDDFLIGNGYVDLGAYQAGLVIDVRNKIFERSGSYFRIKVSVPLPYTTTGNWVAESANFLALSDATIRSDLALDNGATLVSGGTVVLTDNVATMKTRNFSAGQTVATQGYYTKGGQGSGHYVILTSGEYGGTPDEYIDHTIANGNIAKLIVGQRLHAKQAGAVGDGIVNDTLAIQAAMKYAVAKKIVVYFDFNATIRVPNDVDNMQQAFLCSYVEKQDYLIVNIETGHQPTQGLLLVGGDYSNYTIKSTDATVILPVGFTPVGDESCVLHFSSCVAPILDCLIDVDGKSQRGYCMYDGAVGIVAQGGGLIKAISDNLYMASGSSLRAQSTVWTDAGNRGAWVTRGSFFDGQQSDFSGAGTDGCAIRRSAIANISGVVADNCGGNGINVSSAFAICESLTGSSIFTYTRNNTGHGVFVEDGGIAICTALVSQNNGKNGIFAIDNSHIVFGAGNAFMNSEHGVKLVNSTITLNDANVSSNTLSNIYGEGALTKIYASDTLANSSLKSAIELQKGATCSFFQGQCNNAAVNGAEVYDGSHLLVSDGIFNDAGDHGVYCDNAVVSFKGSIALRAGTQGLRCVSGQIYAQNSNARTVDGVDNSNDYVVTNGGIIHANGGTGGTNVTINTISANGIIFK